MKFTYFLSIAALCAALASCGGSSSADQKAKADSIAAAKTADSLKLVEAQNQKAAAQKAAREDGKIDPSEVEEGESLIKGFVTAIEGDIVTINTDNGDVKVLIPNRPESLIEGAPIMVLVKEADGEKKADKDVAILKNYKKLLGKWATEGNAISFELRKNGKCKRVDKAGKQNTVFNTWKLTDNGVITFNVTGGGQNFNMDWNVESVDDAKLVLTQGEARLEMNNVDHNIQ